MKKKLKIVGLLCFMFLFGCSVSEKEVGTSQGNEIIVRKLHDSLAHGIYEITHKESGCKFLVSNRPDVMDIEKINCESENFHESK